MNKFWCFMKLFNEFMLKSLVLLAVLTINLSVAFSTSHCGNIALSTNGTIATAISEGTYLGQTQFAHHVNDGIANTGWSSQWDMPAWIQLDFNQVHTIRVIGVWWGSHQHSFSISASIDGNNWTTLKSNIESNNHEGAEPTYQLFEVAATDCRHLKIDIHTTSAPSSHIFQASINEIEVFTNSFTNVALNNYGGIMNAISEGVYLGNTQYAHHANDDDSATFWASQWDMPAWIQVELSQIFEIEIIGIWWGSHQHDFIVEASLDGTNWNEIIPVTSSRNYEGAPPTHELYSIEKINAKYVRVYLLSTSAPQSHIFQAIINELQVFSENCTTTGLKKQERINAKIFPNPTNDLVTIEFESVKQRELMIFDSKGTLLINKQINTATHTLNLTNIDSGIYILNIIDPDNSVSFQSYSLIKN